mgnify:CR=1 FL=1
MNLKSHTTIKSLLLRVTLPLIIGASISTNAVAINPATAAPETTQQETYNGLFDVYADNRAQNRPNYITADFWLLSYSLIRNTTFASVEQKQVQPLFSELLKTLSASIKDKSNDAAQLANQDYIQLLQALLSGQHQLSSERAKKELTLIIAAKGIATSPLWEAKIDYSQFKPRGRYTENAAQQQYFQAMRYASSVLFALKASKATGISEVMAERMTRQAMLLAQPLAGNKNLEKLESLLTWQMGPADDLTTGDLNKVPKATDIKKQQQALFAYAKKHHKQPKIIAAAVDVSLLEKGTTAADVLTGWRLMPLRYSTDNAVFQQLLYPHSGEYKAAGVKGDLPFGASMLNGKIVKGYPSAKELMALLDSKAAQDWVVKQGENRFSHYTYANTGAMTIIAQAQGLNASQNQLLHNWLKPEKLSAEQAEERLTSSLGFWTWQRYINLLYSKQSYSLSGKSISFPVARPGAKLEKATVLYQGLATLVKQHQSKTPHPAWDEFAKNLVSAIAISSQSDNKLNAKDEAFLNELDKTILSYTSGVSDKPIVVDVHTNPGENTVVEEGIGLAKVVKKEGAWGARFSHYEFKQPLSERLDNEAWRGKLVEMK